MAKLYVIRFECDCYGDHTCDTNNISDVQDATFTDKVDALHFMSECSSNIKNIFIIDTEYLEENEEHVWERTPPRYLIETEKDWDYVNGL